MNGRSFYKTNASILLDLLRGIAAMIVLLEHWRYIFFVGYPQVILHRKLVEIFYVLCASGHQAVIVFFILSGYLVSGSVYRMMDKGTWSWGRYASHRLLRLWIVLIPSLFLCAIWDSAGLRSGLAPLLYHGMSGNFVVGDVAARHTLPTFLGNALFLQNIHVLTFGSNGPLWSLANEFWYYALFPLGLLALRKGVPLKSRLIYASCFVAISLFVGPGILSEFPIWLLGSALALIRPPQIRQVTRIVCAAVYLPLFFVIGGRLKVPLLLSDYLLAAITSGLIWVILSASSPYTPSARVTFTRGLARFSYTLYAVHMPICVLLAALIVGDSRWQPTPDHLLAGMGVLGLVMGYAYIVATFTEFKTERVRNWLESKYGEFVRPRGVNQTLDAEWISRTAVAVCAKCGVWVPSDSTNLHTAWHEKLRRAVDEAEFLG